MPLDLYESRQWLEACDVYGFSKNDQKMLRRVHKGCTKAQIAKLMNVKQSVAHRHLERICQRIDDRRTDIVVLAKQFVDLVLHGKIPQGWELPDEVICRQCERKFVRTDFPYYPIDDRCVMCLKAERESFVQKPRQTAARTAVMKLLRKTGTEHLAMPEVQTMLAEFCHRFDGAGGFVKEWYDQVISACQTNPGSTQILRHFEAIVRMLHTVQAATTNIDDLDNMSDDALRDKIAGLVMERIGRKQVDNLIGIYKESYLEGAEAAKEAAIAGVLDGEIEGSTNASRAG